MYQAQKADTHHHSSIRNKWTPFFQPKLSVNTPGDAHEQEADAVADQVMRMHVGDVPIVQRMPLTTVSGVQRACAHCAEDEQQAQRKATGGGDASGKAAPPIVSEVLSSGGGQAIDDGTRQFMESRFGQDFSSVRIHTSSRAAESANAIHARAYTSGLDVVFGAGEYQPGSDAGKYLLAHELAHTAQQEKYGHAIQRMLACPGNLNDGAPTPAGWREYPNSTSWFHCGFRTILENRAPTPNDPMNECVYDHSGTLVDDHHPYSGCQGTPDQYDSRTDPIKHAIVDSGGIVRQGIPAFVDSRVHDIVQPFQDAYNWLDSGIRNLYGVP